MSSTLYMQTTEVEATRSAAEITSLLVQSGARQIGTEYGDNGKIKGIRFVLPVAGVDCSYDLPARTDALYPLLMKSKPYSSYSKGTRSEYEGKMRETAERVGWRQLLMWVKAQLAIIQTGMVSTQEVFFPYLVERSGRTVFQIFEEQKYKMLTEGEKSNG